MFPVAGVGEGGRWVQGGVGPVDLMMQLLPLLLRQPEDLVKVHALAFLEVPSRELRKKENVALAAGTFENKP